MMPAAHLVGGGGGDEGSTTAAAGASTSTARGGGFMAELGNSGWNVGFFFFFFGGGIFNSRPVRAHQCHAWKEYLSRVGSYRPSYCQYQRELILSAVLPESVPVCAVFGGIVLRSLSLLNCRKL
ncbi:hypothetical protein OPV22_030550 [Ensete ventricosum]|uniref:Uncharacterized protein n=1 Tax=Ensete ventricosum TaxID=4639 RepID=A0AAV8QCC1_ENSVE|nr:hypothetical protein OPV22_030550 [Ensete ventricosum]